MSLNSQEKQCVVCKAYLFPEDDVVFCPTCGAPHHRDCYNSVGHCGLEEFHGTKDQYTAKETQQTEENDTQETSTDLCIRCKRPLLKDADFCPFCGAPRVAEGFNFGRIQGFAEINMDAEIEDGITAKEATPIIAANPIRYLFRFIKTGAKSKLSWNWAAFLFPHAWFSFRKMYQSAWCFSLGMIISNLLTIPFNLAVTKLPGYTDITGGSAMLGRFIVENVNLIDKNVLALAAVGSLLATTLVCEVPFLANAFGFAAVDFKEYILAIALGAVVIPVVEVVKFFQRKNGDK